MKPLKLHRRDVYMLKYLCKSEWHVRFKDTFHNGYITNDICTGTFAGYTFTIDAEYSMSFVLNNDYTTNLNVALLPIFGCYWKYIASNQLSI